MITKLHYSVEKVANPTDDITHVLWRYTESLTGSGYKGVFHGTFKECIEKKKELETRTKSRKRGIKAWMN